MIVTMSRQDLTGVVDYAKNRIIERLVTRDDIQRVTQNAADRIMDDLQSIRKENQPVFRQTLALCDQLVRRTQTLESRIAGLEQDIKEMSQLISAVLGQQKRTVSSLQRY